jgi:hypothetical protein
VYPFLREMALRVDPGALFQFLLPRTNVSDASGAALQNIVRVS